MTPHAAESRAAPPRPLPSSGPLSLGERLLLVREILAAYLYARRALRGVPIASALARIRAGPGSHPMPPPHAHAEALRLGRAVARTLALVPGDTRCLVRSLVLSRLLARRGIPATLIIGARPSPSFLAHAWVEHAGFPVLDPGDGSFGRLVEL